ncbi:hypothetical protein BgiMline_014135 [Biomphalaria glabrata]|nr:hypothetical protein BgiMline_012924 [Biomphalaria glabrata]
MAFVRRRARHWADDCVHDFHFNRNSSPQPPPFQTSSRETRPHKLDGLEDVGHLQARGRHHRGPDPSDQILTCARGAPAAGSSKSDARASVGEREKNAFSDALFCAWQNLATSLSRPSCT